MVGFIIFKVVSGCLLMVYDRSMDDDVGGIIINKIHYPSSIINIGCHIVINSPNKNYSLRVCDLKNLLSSKTIDSRHNNAQTGLKASSKHALYTRQRPLTSVLVPLQAWKQVQHCPRTLLSLFSPSLRLFHWSIYHKTPFIVTKTGSLNWRRLSISSTSNRWLTCPRGSAPCS